VSDFAVVDLHDVYSTGFAVSNEAGAPVNPATSTCTINLPDGTVVTPSLTNPSTGQLRLDFATTQEGRHWGWVETTVPGKREPFEFDVTVSLSIVSLPHVRAKLNFISAASDSEVRASMESATDYIEGIAGAVVRRTIVETDTPYNGCLPLAHWPVLSLTSVVGAYGYSATLDVATLHVTRAGILEPNMGAWLPPYPLTVTYVAGRVVVPALIRDAALDYIRWDWESQRPADTRFTRFSPAGGDDFTDQPTATPPYKIAAKLARYAQPVSA
jgi:hypothetical protein